MFVLVRAARRVARAHLPHHSTAEPVVVGSGYALAAALVHNPVGSFCVTLAYAVVAALAALDARRERRVAECHGRHATCRLEEAA